LNELKKNVRLEKQKYEVKCLEGGKKFFANFFNFRKKKETRKGGERKWGTNIDLNSIAFCLLSISDGTEP
jgi:hypothetical protein